jgi:UDP-glucuronate decarboxylase
MEISVLDLARLVLSMTGVQNGRIEFRALPVDDPKRRRPDISRASELLGWWPTVDLATGLRHTIEDFRVRLQDGHVASSARPAGNATLISRAAAKSA